MNLRLGFAVSNKTENTTDLINKVKQALEVSNEAIELSLTRASKFQQPFTEELYSLINQFKYKSIHAPVRDNELNMISYPSDEGEILLGKIDTIANAVNPDAILFHPDVVKNFNYLNERYGNTLAFENMDAAKSYGKTIKDLEEVFEKSPQAKWVLDINHIYTNDKTMKSAKDFYARFRDRLTHYHVSSLGDFHDCFCRTHEDFILEGIMDIETPMIHEGNAIDKGIGFMEYQYIESYLKIKFQ